MAIFDDDDYYSPEYLGFMLDALRQRGASLVKLGSWPLFYARWQGGGSERMLSGSFWLFNTTATFAQLGWGFSYFFSRSCEAAGVRGITHDSTHDWDQKWVEAIVATGLHAAVVEAHPPWLVIKVHQSDSISRPNPEFLSPLRARSSDVLNILMRLASCDPGVPACLCGNACVHFLCVRFCFPLQARKYEINIHEESIPLSSARCS